MSTSTFRSGAVAEGAPPVGPDGIDQLCINTIRTLSMDAVQKANSGHPGTPMPILAHADIRARVVSMPSWELGFTAEAVAARARDLVGR